MQPNNSNSTQPANVQSAVQLCNLAVDTNNPVTDIGTVMPGWKIVWNGGKITDPNYAFVAQDPTGKIFALAIRGSVLPGNVFTDWDGFVDWIVEDLNVPLVHWPYAGTANPWISAGADVAFTNLRLMQDSLGSGKSLIDFLLANAVGTGKQFFITGHSLGGNMANVYTSYFVETLKQKGISSANVSLFTFAAPAAGNADFANDLDAKVPSAWHYQNMNDVVPNFPVVQGFVTISNLYNPKPEASAITVKIKNQPPLTLQKAFLLLGGLFLKADYQQPKNNYITFTNPIFTKDPKFTEVTIKGWMAQAGYQHQLFNYAYQLGVKLISPWKQQAAVEV